jgi:hypothetical protein
MTVAPPGAVPICSASRRGADRIIASSDSTVIDPCSGVSLGVKVIVGVDVGVSVAVGVRVGVCVAVAVSDAVGSWAKAVLV